MDTKLWKLGFFTALTSFVLLILGTRTILGTPLVFKNYLTFAIFGLTVGMLATLLRFYNMKVGFWIFMSSLTLGFLEMFRSDYFADLSLTQWMSQTPPHLLKEHLNLDDSFIEKLPKEKHPNVKYKK